MPHCLVCLRSDIEDLCIAVDRVRRPPGEIWHIKRCRGCGFGWTSPMPAPEELSFYYPPDYLGDTQKALEEFRSGQLQRSRSWRGEIEKVRLLERFLQSGRILDVGCGDGRFLWALNPARWVRTGVDHSGAVLAQVLNCLPDLRLIVGDIHSTALAAGAFDAVTFWHVLEHLPDPRSVLLRAATLLADEGWLLVSLPNLDSLQARLFRTHWYPFDDVPRHIYHFSQRSLLLLLQETGFQVRRRLLFSPRVNFHSLKHSLLNWSRSRFGADAPYYALKPLLALGRVVERVARKPGIMAIVARKCGRR
jgi:SAM-dependent methyltransferase